MPRKLAGSTIVRSRRSAIRTARAWAENPSVPIGMWSPWLSTAPRGTIAAVNPAAVNSRDVISSICTDFIGPLPPDSPLAADASSAARAGPGA